MLVRPLEVSSVGSSGMFMSPARMIIPLANCDNLVRILVEKSGLVVVRTIDIYQGTLGVA